MYTILLWLILLAALLDLEMTFQELSICESRQCLARIEHASRKVLNIEWRPISVFPEEAKKFRPQN